MTTPILDHLLNVTHDIYVEDGEYVGSAADGVEVLIGTVGNEAMAERYLTDHPTPESW